MERSTPSLEAARANYERAKSERDGQQQRLADLIRKRRGAGEAVAARQQSVSDAGIALANDASPEAEERFHTETLGLATARARLEAFDDQVLVMARAHLDERNADVSRSYTALRNEQVRSAVELELLPKLSRWAELMSEAESLLVEASTAAARAFSIAGYDGLTEPQRAVLRSQDLFARCVPWSVVGLTRDVRPRPGYDAVHDLRRLFQLENG